MVPPFSPQPWPSADDMLGAEVLGRLLDRRHVVVSGPLDDERAARAAAQLMTLDAEGADSVTLHVHSLGGSLPALFTVADTIAVMAAPVDTLCAGQASGTAAALVAAGTGTRRMAPNAVLELRLPVTDVSGTASDVDRHARLQAALRDRLIELIAMASGQDAESVRTDWEQGRFLSAEAALAAGLIDEVSQRAHLARSRRAEDGGGT